MVKLTTSDLRVMKQRGEKIAALTSYDFFTTKLLDEAGVHMILVGDSLGMVVLGYENTLPVTMDEMTHHMRAVARARPRALLVGDMPYRTYDTVESALANARRFVEAGAEGVKLEGGGPVIDLTRALVQAGIPVLGHIGLLPQHIQEMGGYKVQGRTAASADQLLDDAKRLEDAGVFAMVLECVVAEAAERITGAVNVPTIGIGAGPHCDGQILVVHDMLGLGARLPRHSRRYADVAGEMRKAFAVYKTDVQIGRFPGKDESF